MRYTREEGCRAWLTYGLMGPERVADLLDEFGSASRLYEEFLRSGGEILKDRSSEESRGFLRRQAAPEAMHQMMVTMQREEIGIISIDDDRYPDLLRQIVDAPQMLFYRGDLSVLQQRSLTMVDTRRATPQGTVAAKQIARELSEAGVVIVSGLAEGIDSAAHEGCMEGPSPTVGLCACGIDVDYPAGNHDMKEHIVRNGGLLLSEFPLGLPAFRQNFSIRNRVLSGLSRGVVMMECPEKSGAMITVRYALDQGREVFAWPGVLGSENAAGAHQLLREGARFFTSAADILEDMAWDASQLPSKEEKAALPPLSDSQQAVMRTLRERGEQTMDQLAAVTGLDTPSLSTALTMLQIMGLIRSMPGKAYAVI